MGKKKKNSQKKYAKLETSKHGTSKNGKKKAADPPGKSNKGNKRSDSVVTEGSDDYQFRQSVENGSRTIIDMSADGNCLFRSLSDQVYYDHGNSHGEIRSEVCDFIEHNREEFKHFLVHDEEDDDEDAADFETYVRNMRLDGEWGGNLELVAAAKLYRRNIVVYSAGAALTIEHGQKRNGGVDMMVSYHENDHYNSVRDNSGGNPPPPSKSPLRKPKAAIESKENGDTEAVLTEHDDDEGEAREEDQQAASPTGKKPKKNDPCPCGSGLRYKKCCLAADKSKERAKKWKSKIGLAESDNPAETSDVDEMDGDFKVLKI